MTEQINLLLKLARRYIFIFALIIVFLSLGARLKSNNTTPVKNMEGHMRITTVFGNNGNIPSEYTCDGQDLAPELTISGVPQNAKSLALIVDDPDAPMGTWVHWVLYNIPTNIGIINAQALPPDVKQGMTDFGRIGWGGPCPPSGIHRYFFKLYAIDTILDLPEGITKSQLETAINKHIIEKTELIGLYQRNR